MEAPWLAVTTTTIDTQIMTAMTMMPTTAMTMMPTMDTTMTPTMAMTMTTMDTAGTGTQATITLTISEEQVAAI